MVVPGLGDLRPVTRAEMLGNPGYAFTDPERMLGADDALVGGMERYFGQSVLVAHASAVMTMGQQCFNLNEKGHQPWPERGPRNINGEID